MRVNACAAVRHVPLVHGREVRGAQPPAWAERAPVVVALVHDDVAQAAQEGRELAVHGQEAAVQHVRVGDQQLRALARALPLPLPGERQPLGAWRAGWGASHDCIATLKATRHLRKPLTCCHHTGLQSASVLWGARHGSVAVVDLHARRARAERRGAQLPQHAQLVLRCGHVPVGAFFSRHSREVLRLSTPG
jgi:hypothetical protein